MANMLAHVSPGGVKVMPARQRIDDENGWVIFTADIRLADSLRVKCS